ncbi:hypothetical protein SODALDRAFT_334419 [Sodiomyces alkalinus F11]|uniref:Glycoprotease family protein n=1 Tax=Sodiomyces alkalinus (strain CBS 110278 / VKM F-3762 / F11) TaxID=1314773 RepID=A0A3N2PS37_SODAK|nr:hypothetical protein SODALDRAFT_334419 [Sodiomyces alkalinus F11]ROT37329.1 hypothetical protein SODALDRAFT_334419 [Sodiomyces alkalinus F11]
MTLSTQPPRRLQYGEKELEKEVDGWEDWEDEEVITPINDDEQSPIIEKDALPSPLRPIKSTAARASQGRYSVLKIRRLKSRHRQKAQNAKAGIRLITDMSALRQNQLVQELTSPERPRGKFVDAAALRALEGEPSSASVGNWNWLKKRTTKSPQIGNPSPTLTRTRQGSDLSPDDRPIVIGISLPSELAGQGNASTTADAAMLATPLDYSAHPARLPHMNRAYDPDRHVTPLTPSQLKSVWSPDTPDTTSPFQSPRPASSIYSQATGFGATADRDAPPVPTVPSAYQNREAEERLVSIIEPKSDDASDDGGSPCTLFEEDAALTKSPHSIRAKETSRSPGSAETQTRGWWDHVVTPFTEKTSPLREAQESHPIDAPVQLVQATRDEPSKPTFNKMDAEADKAAVFRPGLPASPKPSPRDDHTPIVRVPTPRRTPSPFLAHRAHSPASSSRSATPRLGTPLLGGGHTEKARIATTTTTTTITTTRTTHSPQFPSEEPPPYSPPNQQKPIGYRAVFPAGHPLQALYPPSPGPVSPAIVGTMSSQSAVTMSDIPLTPAPGTSTLPQRLPGTYLPQEHFLASGAPESRIERERRRHEKEEVVARKAGGFWRGRGCVPASGCFGRSGREGRKRRRVWLGVCGAILAIVLVIVLCVVLIPRGGGDAPEVQSIFVNLTNFPPMPTGVMTVVGPDNSAAVTGCTQPTTVWSCSLPKEDHESAAPFRPNQPEFIMQIQWDNGTREAWNIPNGEPPRPGSESEDRRRKGRRSGGFTTRARDAIRTRQDRGGFSPIPQPPSFEEMFFLGKETDGIVSDDKAGEPTPFYLSILTHPNNTVGPNAISKRQDDGDGDGDGDGDDDDDDDSGSGSGSGFIVDLPEPDLNQDGTAAAAKFMPQAFQQPVRLYDRGLPTEHYGFYTYFKRSLYLKSVSVLNGSEPSRGGNGESNVPLDENGGVSRSEANFIVTWTQVRFLVQIWTRRENGTRLLSDGARFGPPNGAATDRPGTMPYPVSITMDTHGGQPGEKFVWHWPVDARQRIDTARPQLIANNIGFGGTVVNPRRENDASFGGFDGGNGGCKCQWVNFLERRGGSQED